MRLIFALLGLFFALVGLPVMATAGLVEIQVMTRDSGRILPVYPHRDRRYIAGTPGEVFAVTLVNRTGQRLLAVLSVDGVNAVTGETASPSQSGYVLEPHGSTQVKGWRKSQDEVAQFYFTALPNSYAARTDRPDHVGVIGVAVFREAAPPRHQTLDQDARTSSEDAAAPPAHEMSRAGAGAGSNTHAMPKTSSRIGTGHGDRETSHSTYADFVRASESPAEVVSLYYDRRDNLVARGIILRPPGPRHPPREPQPFPGTFVPDPR
ncbi:MAG: hypothetical protein WCP34_07375 [Pseudomonadota bacterium]